MKPMLVLTLWEIGESKTAGEVLMLTRSRNMEAHVGIDCEDDKDVQISSDADKDESVLEEDLYCLRD